MHYTMAVIGSRAWQLALRVFIGVGVVMVLYVLLVFIQVTRAADGAQGRTATADAIVVLGAAQYNGQPSPVFERRLETAFELFASGAAPVVVTTGANQPGDVFTEGFAGYRYLLAAGVPDEQIIVIVDGGDTYESLLAAANQLDVDHRSVVVVTDAYHARRSSETAAEVGLDATVVAAGEDTRFGRRVNETIAVALGRIIGYRRLSGLR